MPTELKTREQAVPPSQHSFLVESQPGCEPGHRQDVDRRQPDGRANTEGLKAGHPSDGTDTEGKDVGEAGHRDGDTRVAQ